MWKELNEKQTVFNFGGMEEDEVEEEESINNLNVENEGIGEGDGDDDGDVDIDEGFEQNRQEFRRWKG